MDHKLNLSSDTPVKSVATTWDYGYNIRHSIFLIWDYGYNIRHSIFLIWDYGYNIRHSIFLIWDYGYNIRHSIFVIWDYGYNTRHSIFLITGMCVGVPLVVWALGVLRRHQHNGGRASVFITVLLLTDLLEMFLSPAMVVYLLLSDATRSGSVFLLYFGVKYCGLHLHQMVALEGVIARTYLPFTSLLFWRSFSILFCLLEGVFLLLCLCVHPFLQSVAVTFSWLLVALVPLGFTCKLASTLLPFSSEKYTNGILVAMTVIYPVVCLRLIADPLLCVLVVRELPLDKATARISV